MSFWCALLCSHLKTSLFGLICATGNNARSLPCDIQGITSSLRIKRIPPIVFQEKSHIQGPLTWCYKESSPQSCKFCTRRDPTKPWWQRGQHTLLHLLDQVSTSSSNDGSQIKSAHPRLHKIFSPFLICLLRTKLSHGVESLRTFASSGRIAVLLDPTPSKDPAPNRDGAPCEIRPSEILYIALMLLLTQC